MTFNFIIQNKTLKALKNQPFTEQSYGNERLCSFLIQRGDTNPFGLVSGKASSVGKKIMWTYLL